jgi:hypothetical protein
LNEIFQKGLEFDSLTTQVEVEHSTKLILENDVRVANETIAKLREFHLQIGDRLAGNQNLLLQAENQLLAVRATTREAEEGQIDVTLMIYRPQIYLGRWKIPKI